MTGQQRWLRAPRDGQRRVVGAALAVAVTAIVSVAAVWVGGTPAAADEDCPDGWVDQYGNCHPFVELPIEQPGSSGTAEDDDDGPTTPTTLDPNRCEWQTYPDQGQLREMFPEAPPDAVFGYEVCYIDGNPIYGPYIPQWRVPAATADPVPATSPDEAAVILWARVAGTLEVPSAVTSPPTGTPSVVGVPTFFWVENWQGPQHVSDCVAGVCLSLDATPSLSLDPGDPGAGTVACEDGGTRYVPGGRSAEEQADADDACAHTYRRRTGVAGRPSFWTAQLSVTWEISWSGGGTSGTIGPITMDSSPIEVPVTDVSTVVVEGGG